MELRSRKQLSSKDSNLVAKRIDNRTSYVDLLEYTFYDENDNKYTLKDLLEKIDELEKENEQIKNTFITYSKNADYRIAILTQAHDVISSKLAADEQALEELKDRLDRLA